AHAGSLAASLGSLESVTLDARKRWIALMVLCFGDLMIVLDTTIVNVALPSIRDDLGFSQASLAWVVNAYLLTFGGFLLLGGRLGDLFGHRRLFLIGLTIFTAAPLACGLSPSRGLLGALRAVEGGGPPLPRRNPPRHPQLALDLPRQHPHRRCRLRGLRLPASRGREGRG